MQVWTLEVFYRFAVCNELCHVCADFSGHWFIWIAGMDDSVLANKRIVMAIYGSDGKSEDTSLEVRTLDRYIEHSALPQVSSKRHVHSIR